MSDKQNQIIFLGTGTSQGVPVIGCTHPVCLSHNPKDKRLRASVLVQAGSLNILIDCGPDFRQQMLRENLEKVDAVLITHEHNDHIIGLDDLRPLNFLTGKDMPIYAQNRVLKEIVLRFPYVFEENKYPGAPSAELISIDQKEFYISNEKIIPLPVIHGSLDTFGYRIGNMAYLTDVSLIPKTTFPLLENLDILIIDALRKSPEHYSHLTLYQAIDYARIIKPKKTYFTHISHHIGFYDEVEKELPKNMHLAYDGLRLSFD
ncbi:MAG: MBL fold metallo-hydrolase [Flavobacteriaceae bacterium]|nr:MBL fold metallo-hydrolase [Flavobacteriaceae bacterium]